MLAALCSRPKPRFLSAFLSSFAHGSAVHHHYNNYNHPHVRLVHGSGSGSGPVQFAGLAVGSYSHHGRPPRRHHTSACQLGGASSCGGAASIWHAILPSAGVGRRFDRRRPAMIQFDQKGDGSWNAAVDARPARWLHRADPAWLLFGVCACLAPVVDCCADSSAEPQPLPVLEPKLGVSGPQGSFSDENIDSSADYRVTGVLADGRCLFRAIAHVACLRNGEEAPDEPRQRELADELRAQVVDELLKRREESEWFIEGDFDAYVKNIQQPYVWGGEPELLMASHVLKTPIWVFMIDRSNGRLVNIAKYGEEYGQNEENPINVLFHGYGHYDILETPLEKSCQKQSAC
ncbi:OTU domain containing protein [Parasponia andersonii]|uniref:Ubiquitin thioesterase OTU n=1 Tax=Parasponia andersonii TaxID=3476 RepID=A0A2P5A769_PARAD|nr:OTU domain containing protein [Parasponia andersonii]